MKINEKLAKYIYSRTGNNKKYKVEYTYDEFWEWSRHNHYACQYCLLDIDDVVEVEQERHQPKRYWNTMSIDRIKNYLPYQINNITFACFRCNSIKSSFFNEKEMKKIGLFIRKIHGYK